MHNCRIYICLSLIMAVFNLLKDLRISAYFLKKVNTKFIVLFRYAGRTSLYCIYCFLNPVDKGYDLWSWTSYLYV